jgi:putative ABC transport system permease protein
MTLQGLTEGVGIALESLRAHKVRAALTILGVAIGVMVVMVIGAIVSGFNKGIADMLEQSGPKTFWVGRFFQGGVVVSDGSDEMSPWRRNPPMSLADAETIAGLPSVAWVAVDEGSQTEISYGAKNQSSVSVRGRSAAWPNVAGGDITPGRSFTRVEDAAASQVVVINQKLDELLFEHQDPIGRRIHIQGVPYTVIGVYNPPPQLFGGQPSPEAVIPHGALVKYVRYWRGWMDFLVGPTEEATTAQAMEDVTEALRLRRALRPGQDNNFAVVSQEKFLESLNSTTLLIRIVMFALSGVGLMVGGIGVIAIMMISVTERTREIGVRKALGATRRAILWQFLVEAATLTLVGGMFGLIGGGLVALLLAHATPIPAHVPLASIVVALAVAALTGIVFGLYPASRASRLDPVEALRYE